MRRARREDIYAAPSLTGPCFLARLTTVTAAFVEPVFAFHCAVPRRCSHAILFRRAGAVAVEVVPVEAAMPLSGLPPAPAIGDQLSLIGDSWLVGHPDEARGNSSTSCYAQDCCNCDPHHISLSCDLVVTSTQHRMFPKPLAARLSFCGPRQGRQRSLLRRFIRKGGVELLLIFFHQSHVFFELQWSRSLESHLHL